MILGCRAAILCSWGKRSVIRDNSPAMAEPQNKHYNQLPSSWLQIFKMSFYFSNCKLGFMLLLGKRSPEMEVLWLCTKSFYYFLVSSFENGDYSHIFLSRVVSKWNESTKAWSKHILKEDSCFDFCFGGRFLVNLGQVSEWAEYIRLKGEPKAANLKFYALEKWGQEKRLGWEQEIS